MLAMYSSVLKKEKFMRRFSEDSSEAASIANDLTCDLKILSASSLDGKLDSCLDQIKSAEENLKILNALVNNLKTNLEGYVESLVQREKAEETQQVTQTQQLEDKSSVPEEKQLSDIMSVIRTLKELKDSIPNEK